VLFSTAVFSQNQSSSIVHVYLPKSWSRDVQVLFNDREVCAIRGHEMLAYEIYSVGYLRITVKTSEAFGQSWTSNANVNIKDGENYYFSVKLPTFRWSKFEIIQKDKNKNIIAKKEDQSSPITEPPLN
jgi:hypothetical protein